MEITKEAKQEKYEKLFDEFAGIALNALISKAPFFDANGKHGKQVEQSEIDDFKKTITLTAYEYAGHMLNARQEYLQWLKSNLDIFD